MLVGAAVAAGTFALAKAQIFEPEAPAGAVAGGDFYRGQVVFERECASCHGAGGEGGAGPRLVDSGLDAAAVAAAIEQGGGAMPPGLVSGNEEADTVAFVVSIAEP